MKPVLLGHVHISANGFRQAATAILADQESGYYENEWQRAACIAEQVLKAIGVTFDNPVDMHV